MNVNPGSVLSVNQYEVTGKPLSFFYGNAPMPEDTSDKEKEILMKYRKATAQQKKLIESLIDAVMNNG